MNLKLKEKPCISCGKPYPKRKLKKIGKKYYCKGCAVELRKNHRKQTIRQEGIEKELRHLNAKINNTYRISKKEIKALQKPSKRVRTTSLIKPQINNSKKSKPFFKIPYLTKSEKQFLWKKYTSLGYSNEETKQIIDEFTNFQSELYHKLKSQKKTDSEINQIFKKEFWKLCQEIEK